MTFPTRAAVVTNIAERYGLDPVTCLADGWVESELDPTAEGDWSTGGPNGPFVPADTPGSHPTSFGAWQLHETGELGNLTAAEAFILSTNAEVALAQFRATHLATGLTGGALAAAAQRPASPEAYAHEVDAVIAAITSGHPPAGYLAAADAPANCPLPFPPPAPAPLPTPSKKSPSAAALKLCSLVLMANVTQATKAEHNGWVLWYWGVDGRFHPQVDGRPTGINLYANTGWQAARR